MLLLLTGRDEDRGPQVLAPAGSLANYGGCLSRRLAAPSLSRRLPSWYMARVSSVPVFSGAALVDVGGPRVATAAGLGPVLAVPAGGWDRVCAGPGPAFWLDPSAGRLYQRAGAIDRRPSLPAWSGGVAGLSLGLDDFLMVGWVGSALRCVRIRAGVVSEAGTVYNLPEDRIPNGADSVWLSWLGGRLVCQFGVRTPDDVTGWQCLAHSDTAGASWSLDLQDNGSGGGGNHYRHANGMLRHLGRLWTAPNQRGVGFADVWSSADGANWSSVPVSAGYQWRGFLVPVAGGVVLVQGQSDWAGGFFATASEGRQCNSLGWSSALAPIYGGGSYWIGGPGQPSGRIAADGQDIVAGVAPANAGTVLLHGEGWTV